MTGSIQRRNELIEREKEGHPENESTRFQVAEIMLNVSGPIKVITLESN